MALSTVTLKWNLTDLVQGGQTATLIITPSAQLSDSADHVLVTDAVPRRVIFSGGTGQLAGIIANDSGNVLPQGAGYTIEVVSSTGQVIVPLFQTQILVANGAIQWLDQLAIVPVVATQFQYLPLPSGTPTAGYVPVATGSGEATAWQAQSGGGSGAVSSVFGRTGAVVATTGDYAVGQVTGAAPLAGAAFTGNVSVSESATAGGILTVTNSHTTPTSPTVQYTAQTAADLLVGLDVTGDTVFRFTQDSNGKQAWGPGSAATDVNLQRTTTGKLQVTGNLTVQNAPGAPGNIFSVVNTGSTVPTSPNVQLQAKASGDPELGIGISTDTVLRLVADSNGKLSWGPGGSTAADTVLQRSSAGVLQLTTGQLAMNSQKITALANGSASSDAAAFGQIPTALPPNGTAGGDLSGTYPNPTVAKTNGVAFGTAATQPSSAFVAATGGAVLDEGGAVFNVKAAAYGATGNGTTNDATAIQSAVTAAISAGGGVVWFPIGTFLINSTIQVYSATNVKFDGPGTLSNGVANGPMVRFRNSQYCATSRTIVWIGNWASNSIGLELDGCLYGDFWIRGDEWPTGMRVVTSGSATQNCAYNDLNLNIANSINPMVFQGSGTLFASDNRIYSVQAGLATGSGIGINFVQYTDSNKFRWVSLSLNTSGQQGIVFNSGSPSSDVGVYENDFDLAILQGSTTGTVGITGNTGSSPELRHHFVRYRLGGSTLPTNSISSTSGIQLVNSNDGLNPYVGASPLSGSGAPSGPGYAGQYYLRTDTPSTANQRIYVCTTASQTSATWTAIL